MYIRVGDASNGALFETHIILYYIIATHKFAIYFWIFKNVVSTKLYIYYLYFIETPLSYFS